MGTSITGGNPTVDSDRVKASVVGAGSTDFGGSQMHYTVNQRETETDKTADKKRQSLLGLLVKRQEDMLFSLSEFLKGKSNVHKEIHRKVVSMLTNWCRIMERGGIAGLADQPKTMSAVDTQTTPTLKQRSQQQDGSGRLRRLGIRSRPREGEIDAHRNLWTTRKKIRTKRSHRLRNRTRR